MECFNKIIQRYLSKQAYIRAKQILKEIDYMNWIEGR